MHPQSITSSIPANCPVKQSAIGSAINRLHSCMARISESLDYTEKSFAPALRLAEPQVNPKPAYEIESDLHRELLAIEERAEQILFAIDQLRARSTL